MKIKDKHINISYLLCFDLFVRLYSSYQSDYFGSYAHYKTVGRWEDWDIRVQILYIIFAQLSLHVLGSLRKWKISRRINVALWLLGWSSELVSAIALGKLSKLNKCEDDSSCVNILNVLWAPTILFYLGGPDTITVLSLEEADTWVRHFIGLTIHGLIRTSNILWVAWTENRLSLVALLMFIPGIIKYGEKVWNIWSRTEGHFEGFVRSDDLNQHAGNNGNAGPESDSKLILRASSYFQTLKPHNLKYFCDWEEQKKVVASFNKWIEEKSAAENAFKLIEIELGFMHDMLFNRIGTIFTIWGCIIRFVSFSFLVCILWIFCCDVVLKFDDYGAPELVDPIITLILLLGAIFFDVAGVVVQLSSDWAVIWASRHQSTPLNPISRLGKHCISKPKSERWSGYIGQYDLLTSAPGKMKWSRNVIKIPPNLRDLIINQLLEKWRSNADEVELEPFPTLAMRRGAWMPTENQNEFKWSMGPEFGESIVTWHIVTEICYRLSKEQDEDISEQVEATKTLSRCMMYLLICSPSNFSFCNTSSPVMDCRYVKKILHKKGSEDKVHDLLLEAECDPGKFPMIHRVRTLANNLKEEEDRWKIMSNIWVEMLSYAASNCPVRQHAQDIGHGGKFLTHVWLLLLHLGATKRLASNCSQNLIDSVLEMSSEVDMDALGCQPNCLA
ncbi:hypothetical protein NMG60_11023244 [Bertholletia excelsa]